MKSFEDSLKSDFTFIKNDIEIIEGDVSEAIQAYRSGDFKFFGQKIGQTLILATQDSVPENLFLY
jgi:hypothetical protein